MTLNRPIPIKTAKNIVTFINNNTFIHGLTGSTEPGGTESSNTEPSSTEPSTVRHGDVDNKSSNNKGKSTTYLYNNNPPDFTVNINFFNCHFDNNG